MLRGEDEEAAASHHKNGSYVQTSEVSSQNTSGILDKLTAALPSFGSSIAGNGFSKVAVGQTDSPTHILKNPGGAYSFNSPGARQVTPSGQSLPNPGAQPIWHLGKDPDPMLHALFENMLAIEGSLIELKMKANLFYESVNFMCRTMSDQALCVARLCHEDAPLGPPTSHYVTVSSESIARTAFLDLGEQLDLKVFEPINVNLSVLREIKARAYERDTLRKSLRSSRNLASAEHKEFALLTTRLFDELAALKKHRYDVIRGIYDGLKNSQRRFFETVSSFMADTDLDLPPKTMAEISPSEKPLLSPNAYHNSPLSIKTKNVQPANKSEPTAPVMTLQVTPLAGVTRKDTIIVAKPIAAMFDPDADKVRSTETPAFSRFSRPPVKETSSDHLDEYGDDNVDDFAEWKQKKAITKSNLTGETIKDSSSSKVSIGAVPKASVNIEDEDEFDTV